MRKIANLIKNNYGIIVIIVAMLIGDKVSTLASWWNIIRDNLLGIMLSLFIWVISGIIIKYYMDNR
jgi:hypothetical protein